MGWDFGLGLGLGLAFGATRIATSRAPEGATGAEAEQMASASVTVAIAGREPIQQTTGTTGTTGTVEAFDLLPLSPRASGLQILAVRVREGDRVETNQVLAVLDDAVLRAQIEQAQARVGRYKSLFAKGAISVEALAYRRTTATTKRQTVGSAIAAVDSAEATIRSGQAEVNRLMTQLAQTEVLAPASGVIASKTATVGDMASAGTPLSAATDFDDLYFYGGGNGADCLGDWSGGQNKKSDGDRGDWRLFNFDAADADGGAHVLYLYQWGAQSQC